ncbi:class I SAM-dependent methyltransferase [Enterococcus sp. AZ196]|uniref:class I SAM-dependent methyltransferase n=1 Tax=Enterococcus sp. AZ196 TaxID=2774659 RepID=UPI003D2D2DBF
MKFILLILLFLLVLYVMYKYLLQQSKEPSGLMGKLMMKLWNKVYLPMAKWCLSFLEAKEFSNVLDIGVGNGATTKYISETFVSSSIIGIDISKAAIEQARRHNAANNVTFDVMDVSNTAFPMNHFDLVCAFQNHFHWKDLRGSFLEISRILSNKGVFLIGCEYSKISYFLPELKESHSFETFLGDLGFQLIQVKRQRDWIFYKIRKI